jgi:hypothetical protein
LETQEKTERHPPPRGRRSNSLNLCGETEQDTRELLEDWYQEPAQPPQEAIESLIQEDIMREGEPEGKWIDKSSKSPDGNVHMGSQFIGTGIFESPEVRCPTGLDGDASHPEGAEAQNENESSDRRRSRIEKRNLEKEDDMMRQGIELAPTGKMRDTEGGDALIEYGDGLIGQAKGLISVGEMRNPEEAVQTVENGGAVNKEEKLASIWGDRSQEEEVAPVNVEDARDQEVKGEDVSWKRRGRWSQEAEPSREKRPEGKAERTGRVEEELHSERQLIVGTEDWLEQQDEFKKTIEETPQTSGTMWREAFGGV